MNPASRNEVPKTSKITNGATLYTDSLIGSCASKIMKDKTTIRIEFYKPLEK